MFFFCDTGQLLIIFIIFGIRNVYGIILSGAPDSYARYPKWAHSFENSLSLEFKTKQSDGLILYTDDGAINGNFYALTIADGRIQLDFRLGDNTNDIHSRRTVNTIRIEEIRVDDDRWHTLSLFQSWENVKLELDYTLVFKILNQRSFVFGNILKNSDVFVGGVPPDIHQLPLMSSPLKRYARHLAANIRNLVYRLYPQGVTSPQLIDVHGARQNEDDYCRPSSYASRELFVCHNDGHCLNTNEGPKCECSQSDHEGKHCDVEKLDGELTFAGQEWVGYDVVPKISGPIRIKRENVTLSFKTVHGSAMLFTAGDEKNYLSLIMEDGALIASSKFEGTDRRMIRMFNSISGERYDDDLWHTVVLERSLQMMTLTVDGRRDEIRQYAPDLDWIVNAFSYLGGVPKDKSIQEINQKFFRGCMKKVKYEADAHLILFLNLADQGYGESIIRTGGELSFSCKSPFNPPDVLSFTSGRSYLPLPKWGALASGSLSFHFRTAEPDGLILYHGNMGTNSSDYIAFELIDGHLHMVINLGSGVVRLQTTAQKVTDGTQWHNVYLERVGRTGSVVVDNVKTDFNTPGVSSNFIVEDPVFLGFVPSTSISFPSSIWSITLRKGFIGCIKNVRFNGISSKIAAVFEQSNATEITIGCPNTQQVDHCERNPCHNFGRCENRQNTYKCDCAATNKEGPACNIEPTPVELGEEQILHILPHTIYSEAESIEIRFKTDVGHGVLLATKSNSKPNNRLMIHLNNSALEVLLENENGRNMFKWGNYLSDNQWHLLRMKRRGDKVLLFLDGKWEQNNFLPTSVVLAMDEVIGGRAMDSMTESFKGFVSSMMFNEMDLLESKKYGKTNKDGKGQRNIKSKISSVSFMNTTGYLVYSSSMIKTLSGSFRISFKFQTLARSAILFATFPSDNSDSITIELFNGRIRYTYKSLNGEQSVISPKLRNNQHLSDMRWHTLLLYQDEKTQDHMLLVDNTTTVMNCIGKAELVGVALLGGVPPYLRSSQSVLWKGYRGCIANYKLNDRLIDALEESEANSSVVKGCMGPIARCSLSACANQGRCIQQWSSIRCECSLTAYSGDRCQDAATTVVFRGEFSAIFYEYPLGERPSTSRDYLVMAFKTTQSSGVLYSIECTADQDYLTLYIQNGYIQVKYNLGSRDHHFGYFVQPLNDGEKHRIRLHREEANMTLQVDGKTPIRYRPRGTRELVTLNMQWRLVLGASMNRRHFEEMKYRRQRKSIKLHDQFLGEISGVNFNGIMMLDLHSQGSQRLQTIGRVDQKYIAKITESKEEDVMADQIMENPTEALIESIGPGCLSLEEQESCYIETESAGFFTPVLPSTATDQRRATNSPPKGELATVDAVYRVSQTTATTTTTINTRIQSTTAKIPPVIYLSQMDEFESSGNDSPPPILQLTPATKPLVRTALQTRPSYPLKLEPLMVTTIRGITEDKNNKITVLPRPYDSVKHAVEENPEYLGESIWSDIDLLPEPMITGPAWRTHLTRNTTLPTTTTTTTIKTQTTQTTLSTQPTMKTRKKSTMATSLTTRITSTTAHHSTTKMTLPPLTSDWVTTHSFSAIVSKAVTKQSKPKTTPSFPVHPGRPNTPMAGHTTTTMKPVEVADFPRTALISIASVSVIMVIAVVVFCVFRCRQNPPPSDHYPMTCNGKSQSGYTPIAPELSPPLGMDRSTQPLLGRPAPQQVNGHGYQPLKGSVIPNGTNGYMNGVRNGNGPAKNGLAKKKDFKEWYV